MKKTAIFPYTSDGYGQPLTELAPGLPSAIEGDYTQKQPASSMSRSGEIPSWVYPVGALAGGLLGWKLLRGLAKKNKAMVGAAEKAVQQGEAAGLGTARAAETVHPLERVLAEDASFASQLYPKSPVGMHAGQYAKEYFQQNPHLRKGILRELEKAKKG